MLRTLFVLALTVIGGAASLQGPVQALLFYLWVAYFRPESWIYSGWFADANISLIAGIIAIVRILASKDRLRLDAGTALLMAVVVHGGISILQSEYSAYVYPAYINFVKSIVISVIIASLATNASRFRLIFIVIGLSLGADAAKQGWVYLLTIPGAPNINDIPFLGDNNSVAVGMLMLVPILLALVETSSRRWEKYFWIAMTIGVGYRAFSTYSRGGFLAAGVLVLLYTLRAKKYRFRRTVLVFAATAVLLSTMPTQFWDRMETIQADDEEGRDRSAAGRLHFWSVALKIAAANPVLGVGNGAYNFAYDSFDDSDGLYGSSRSVHSAWFGLVAEGGYLGLFLALCVLARALLQSQRLCRRFEPDEPQWKYARAIQNSLLAFCVGGSFVPLQYNEMFWHFMGLSFGLSAFLVTAPAAVRAVAQAQPLHPAAVALMRGRMTTGSAGVSHRLTLDN